jgi:hypothetical protein
MYRCADDDDDDDDDFGGRSISSSKKGKKPKKVEAFVDDWSYHQEQQRCDFYDCRTPRGDTVSWVLCTM